MTYSWLEVSMENFSIMSMLNCQRNLDEQLENFTFRYDIGSIRQDTHDFHVLRLHHHLERTRVQEVTYEHAGRISKGFVCRGVATPQRGIVHDVIV